MNRSVFEALCRGVAIAALVAGVVLSWQAHLEPARAGRWRVMRIVDTPTSDSATSDPAARDLSALRPALWQSWPAGDTIALPVTALPPASFRAALGAMTLAGVPLRWMDSTGTAGLALSVTREPTPRSVFDVRVSMPVADGPLALRDAGGLLDSLPAASDTPRTVGWRLAASTPPVTVQVNGGSATQHEIQAQPSRRLMVMGLPGWESKFTIAALEELGWPVDGTLRISPTGAVTVGTPQRLDTARYAAAVILDSMAVDTAALHRFVRQGGGLVLSGDALRIPALAAHGPARALMVRNATAGALLTPTPRLGLEAWELGVPLGAEVLLRDAGSHGHDEVIVAAHRLGAGRVVASGYRQLWRWRMEGTDDGIDEHRRWWSSLVALALADGSVPKASEHDVWPGEVAPYADLVALAGAPVAPRPSAAPVSNGPHGFRRQVPAILFGLAALSLLAEWASRRLRGLR